MQTSPTAHPASHSVCTAANFRRYTARSTEAFTNLIQAPWFRMNGAVICFPFTPSCRQQLQLTFDLLTLTLFARVELMWLVTQVDFSHFSHPQCSMFYVTINIYIYTHTHTHTHEGWNFNFGNAAVTFDTAHLQSSYFHRPSMYSPKLCRTRSQR